MINELRLKDLRTIADICAKSKHAYFNSEAWRDQSIYDAFVSGNRQKEIATATCLSVERVKKIIKSQKAENE